MSKLQMISEEDQSNRTNTKNYSSRLKRIVFLKLDIERASHTPKNINSEYPTPKCILVKPLDFTEDKSMGLLAERA